jgi:starch synthase
MASPRESLRVVIAASEAVPFSKTGGLADVAGALAKSLDQLGHDVTLILPDYFLLRQGQTNLPSIVDAGLRFSIPMNGRVVGGAVNWTTLPNSSVRNILTDVSCIRNMVTDTLTTASDFRSSAGVSLKSVGR